MTKAINKALQTPEAQALLAAGLKLKSTKRQLANGTIALTGRVKKRAVSYKITATGSVLSNEFVARRVLESTEGQLYRAGLRAAAELLAKRKAA
jgi:hypothetical protein